MTNYQQGKIYKIVGNGKIYVGSTCKMYLCQRLTQHKYHLIPFQNGTYGYTTSFECITDPNHYIELLELCPCNSKDELHLCERKWIDQLECVNKYIPTRTKQEYHNKNKEHISQYKKEWANSNQDALAKRSKEYYQENKEKIKEYKKKMHACDCGSIIRYSTKAQHERSKKHQAFLSSQL